MVEPKDIPNRELWTLPTLKIYCDALTLANKDLMIERDRRYAEVSLEKEKALKIKDEADKAALGLAREIQMYKDEKANQLREQISSERGSMATKEDLAAITRELTAMIQPLATYVAGMAGEGRKSTSSVANIVAAVSVIYGVVATIGVFFALLRH